MTWPLAISPFTVADRLKIGWWLMRGHQMTAGPMVRQYEKRWEDYTGAAHAIMVANGSVANELIAIRRKDELVSRGLWPARNGVLLPVCTWITSVSPWLHHGFKPVWADVSTNLCVSVDEIYRLLVEDRGIGTVFYTTILGQGADLMAALAVCDKFGARLMLDNCESSLSWNPQSLKYSRRHFCAVATSSTSFYFSHPATTGTEGGMIFCADREEADWFRMMRNHGLTRGMPEKYLNPKVHPAFDFRLLGTNARSSDLQAYMGSVTFDRSLAFAAARIELASVFYSALDPDKFDDPTQGRLDHPPMALPIVPLATSRISGAPLTVKLDRLGIEHRPIVGGNLLRHAALHAHGDANLYPRAQHLHNHAAYVGLHPGVTKKMVLALAAELNR